MIYIPGVYKTILLYPWVNEQPITIYSLIFAFDFPGMIEVKERQTAAFLKTKILEVLQSYGVNVDQIFSITVDNGANMLAAVNEIKHEFDMQVSQQLLSDGDSFGNESAVGFDDDPDTETDIETDMTHDKSQELSESLSTEFKEQLNLVRCSVHTLQLAVLDVVDKTDKSVKQITQAAKTLKRVKYKLYFDQHDASFPPIWGPTRWGGIFEMLNSFRSQKDFFMQLGLQYPELGKDESFIFILRNTLLFWC